MGVLSLGEVQVHVGVRDNAVSSNDIGASHRQFEVRIALGAGQINPLAPIEVMDDLWQLEHEAKATGDGVVLVAQHIELEFILFHCRKRVVWRFRRDRNKRSAEGFDFG